MTWLKDNHGEDVRRRRPRASNRDRRAPRRRPEKGHGGEGHVNPGKAAELKAKVQQWKDEAGITDADTAETR
jgi:hypothetical protein